MERTELNSNEIEVEVEEAGWENQAEVMENNQHPLPRYFKKGGVTRKSRMLNIRLQPMLMTQYEQACELRGVNLSEATRELISGWLRQPNVLPIGVPVTRH